MMRKYHVRFGGGRLEKEPAGYLVSRLPYGFYPTPHQICEFMTRMTFGEGVDHRKETVLDPCVGTGRFLLHAGNHSLRLYGMDIGATRSHLSICCAC